MMKRCFRCGKQYETDDEHFRICPKCKTEIKQKTVNQQPCATDVNQSDTGGFVKIVLVFGAIAASGYFIWLINLLLNHTIH